MQTEIKPAIKEGKTKFILKVNIVQKIREDVLIIGDASGTGILVGSGNMIGHMEQDKSYSVILPEIKKIQGVTCFLATRKTIRIQKNVSPNIKSVTEVQDEALSITEDFTKETGEPTSQNSEDIDMSSPGELTVPDLENLDVGRQVRKITLKAVHVGATRGSPPKTFRVVKFRDIKGNPICANFYGKHQEQIKSRTVYHIQNISKSKFKAPSEAFHRFNTTEEATRLTEYPDPDELYKNLFSGDYLVRGTIEGFPYENLYACCPNCSSKVEMLAEKCGNTYCGKRLYERKHDFNYKLNLIAENGDDIEFFGFRRHLKEDVVVETPEELQDLFDKFKGENVEIDYSIKQEQNNIEVLTIL